MDCFKKKKVLVYGTGKKARDLVLRIKNSAEIIGVLDRQKVMGEFCGYQIFDWENNEIINKAEIIIIASSYKYYEEIYKRILFQCKRYGLHIFNDVGEDMEEMFCNTGVNTRDIKYFGWNKDRVIKEIDFHDAISFDVFGTLIARDVIDPMDVFYIVENRLRAKNIELKDFARVRRTADVDSRGGSIYEIYRYIQNIYELDNETVERIIEEEIAAERETLFLRDEMKEILDYAVASGKRVTLISDMYFTRDILNSLLSELNVSGYGNIMVSCEMGVGKGNGLFRLYKKGMHSWLKCLHIGDDENADIISARAEGIDAIRIYNPVDLFQASSISRCFYHVESFADKLWLGKIAKELFGNPFCLYEKKGIPIIMSIEQLAKALFVPIVLAYVNKVETVMRENKCSGILWGARDGWLFYRVYNEIYDKQNSVYFLSSRKQALRATTSIETWEDYKELFLKYEKPQNLVDNMFDAPEIKETTDRNAINEYMEKNKDRFIKTGRMSKNNQLRYINQCGISLDEKYVFCDLVSTGTVHSCLNRLFSQELKGVYFKYNLGYTERQLDVDALYDDNEWRLSIDVMNFFEFVFSSPDASIDTFSSEGNPIFEKENRTKDIIEIMTKMQNSIIESIRSFINRSGVENIGITRLFARAVIGELENIDLSDSIKKPFINLNLENNINSDNMKIGIFERNY